MAALPLQAPTVPIKSHQSLPQALVDRLGKLNAELAPLINEQEAIKALLRESGLEVIEGDLFRATSVCSESRLAKLVPAFTTATVAPAVRIAVKAKQGV